MQTVLSHCLHTAHPCFLPLRMGIILSIPSLNTQFWKEIQRYRLVSPPALVGKGAGGLGAPLRYFQASEQTGGERIVQSFRRDAYRLDLHLSHQMHGFSGETVRRIEHTENERVAA